jgi:dihydrofolate synthase/folylpolyglutamate synthase
MVQMPHWPVPLGKKPIDLDLSRICALLDGLGNPELKLPPVVHVAGTNGKGSTIAFMRAMCEAAGLRVHVYTSPHLVSFNERIVLAGENIADDALFKALETCRLKTEELGIEVTFFEGTTAAAMLAMSEVEADICFLETGLGGRLDATNVLPKPALTVITPVDYDHTEFLGDDIVSIAGEKAGILKKNVPCVVASQLEAAKLVIAQKAEALSAPLITQGRDFDCEVKGEALVFSFKGKTQQYPLPNLLGAHQYGNAAVALAAIHALEGLDIPLKAQKEGITHASWPARLQRLESDVFGVDAEVWLDGGHNPAAARVIAEALKKADRPVYMVLGMLGNKDIEAYLSALRGYVQFVVAVDIPDEPMAKPKEEIMNIAIELGFLAEFSGSVEGAITLMGQKNEKPAVILIAGSLYLAGNILAQMEK